MPSLDEIFLNARERADPVQRAAYLEQACAGDAGLRARVEAMLREAARADAFFGPQDAAVVRLGSPLSEGPGTVIGRYKLLQKIGEGGMGVVYMAEQREPVVRKVALKIIRLGMDTKQVIARFEAERQALALMDHPNIAKVLDGGATETGRPYFVMELVQGLPITQFCDDGNFPTGERIKLFLDVCSAVQHAHQKGIIHRDLKPSNILVTLHGDKPVPKVIDFGVAKATQGRLTEKTLFTQFQQFIGTPAYMSPEQTSLSGLDVDTRSDIYALGVLLYELLTGKTPFDAKDLINAGLDEMRRTLREKEPPRPSARLSTLVGEELTSTARHRHTVPPKLIHQVRGDLDWIVMKCLEKDRARRYETANGLAMDLQRHLANEPVIARPPSKTYRMQKTIRRNKLAFTAAGMVAVSLLIGIVATSWQAVRARRAEREAVQNAVQVRAVLDLILGQLLLLVNPHSDPVFDPNKAAMLERFLVAVDGKFNPSLLGPNAGALGSNRPTISDTNALANQPMLEAQIRSALGQGLSGLRDYARAAVQHERALTLRRQFLGEDHPDTLHNAARLAYAFTKLNRTSEADALLETTISTGHASRFGLTSGLGAALWGKGYLLMRQQNPAAALPYFDESLRVMRQTVGEKDSDVGGVLNWIAYCAELLGNTNKAERLWAEAVSHNDEVYGRRYTATTSSLAGQGQFFVKLGRTNEAIQLLEEAASLQRTIFGPDGIDTLNTEYALGGAYERAGQLAKAAECFATQPARMVKFFAIEDTIGNCLGVADFFRRQGRTADAVAAETLVRDYLKAHPAEQSRWAERLTQKTE